MRLRVGRAPCRAQPRDRRASAGGGGREHTLEASRVTSKRRGNFENLLAKIGSNGATFRTIDTTYSLYFEDELKIYLEFMEFKLDIVRLNDRSPLIE